jgi:flagellar biosynthetic protein FliQ
MESVDRFLGEEFCIGGKKIMTQEMIIGIARNAVELTLLLSLPTLIAGLVVGVLVSIFQAATQIQEMTLSFVPKLLAIFLVSILTFPFLLNKLLDFTRNLIEQIPVFIR